MLAGESGRRFPAFSFVLSVTFTVSIAFVSLTPVLGLFVYPFKGSKFPALESRSAGRCLDKAAKVFAHGGQ